MNRFALILSGIFFFQHGFTFADERNKSIDVEKYEDYFGYFLESLSYAQYLHPNLAIPKITEISAGYYALLGARDLTKAVKGDVHEGIVRTLPEMLSDVGFTAVVTAGNMAGYAVHGTFAPYFLSGAIFTVEHFLPISGYFNAHLTGLRESYDLDEFTDVEKRKRTYLACSYTDPDAPTKNFKIWADERLIGAEIGLKNFLEFRKNTVLLRGRWILVDIEGKESYVFGTIADPLLLQAACIEAVAAYAEEEKIDLGLTGRIKISTGKTSMANSYPIRFYNPTLLKHPKWSKMKPLIMRKAVLLAE